MTGQEPGGRGEEAVTEGLLPLKALRCPLDLPKDAYYPRLMLLLLLALEENCGEAARQAALDRASLSFRRELAATLRGGLQRVMLLSAMLTRHVNDTEICLSWFALSLEAGCALAQRMEDNPARRAVHFLLPEYLDALYRLSNLYYLQTGRHAGELLCQYPEIMPGRPLASCIRPPRDGVSGPWQEAGLWDEMALAAMCAVAIQARAACIQASLRAQDGLCREMYQEIALICQQHETQLSSLLPRRAPLGRLRTAQYLTAFLYDSCGMDETLPGPVRAFAMGEEKHALGRLRITEGLMRREDPALRELPSFPEPLMLRPCKGYVRDALQGVGDTMLGDRIVPAAAYDDPAARQYRRFFCPEAARLPSQRVIRKVIAETGRDDRFEIARHPVATLRDRSRPPAGLGLK